MSEIIIAGGGPAGAVCAETLARAGVRTTVIDDHLAWEKPCGGGLTQKAIRAFPFLRDGPYPKKMVREIELIAGSDARARLPLDEPMIIYSRRVLNGLLLERAERAGCRVVRARVTALAVDSPRPRLWAGAAEFSADFVVVAAGARNRLLPGTSPIEPADLEQTLGYYVPVQSDVLKIKFLPRFRGYLWSFPRPDHLSVGICGKLDACSSAELRDHLEKFIREERLPPEGACFFSHLLPSPRPGTVRSRPILGPNWALAGDAAATVDAITGEGLHYALRSGELLGECLAAGHPEKYPARLRAEFGAELERAARLAPRFFGENFLGRPVTRRTVEFARRSPTFRRLLAAFLCGEHGYRSVQLRFWAQLPISLAEIGCSYLASPRV
ncbi:MAG TPA: NAD(P)/FAD-dependent oxidoreductase [Patescibacteria group bacterium]|nr:NAD(P)/FAD-dependent oxidoreductase [Patescibacteria group bacterium]